MVKKIIKSDTSIILGLINIMENFIPYNESYDREVKSLVSIWTNFLNQKKVKKFSDIINEENESEIRYYDMNITFGNNEVHILFNIERINKMISKNEIKTKTISLMENKDIIKYSETGDTVLLDKIFPIPVLAVKFISSEGGRNTSLEIIDGNHRVSAALKNNIDLDIFIIEEYILSPYCFGSVEDWAFYQIILGFAIVTNNLYWDNSFRLIPISKENVYFYLTKIREYLYQSDLFY